MTLRVSNAALLDIIEVTTNQIGWEIQVFDRDDPTQHLTTLPRWKRFSFSKVLSDLGAAKIELDLDDPQFGMLLNQLNFRDDENIVKFVRHGLPRFAWLNEDDGRTLVQEDETRSYEVSGRGAGSMLEWATVLPPAYPDQTGLNWTWAGVPGLWAWLDLKEAADLRGSAASLITPTFTRTFDSAGVAWEDANNLTLKPGGDLMALLKRFAEASEAEWQVDPIDLHLNAKINYGFRRENQVRFFVTADQIRSETRRSRRGIANVVYTISANGQVPFVVDEASRTKWGRREILVETANAQDSITAQGFGQIVLNTTKEETLSATFKVRPDMPNRTVFVDYDIGDWVWIDSDDEAFSGPYRVVAISMEVDEEGNEDLELTVNSALSFRLVQLQKQFERETGSTLRVDSELQVSNAGSGTGFSGLNKFSTSDVALGVLAPSSDYTWFTVVGVPSRAMIWRLKFLSGGSINWGIQITSQPLGAGELMFEAVGIGDVEYSESWPWVYENQSDPPTSEMYVGIRNIAGATSAFTLVDMRGESLV